MSPNTDRGADLPVPDEAVERLEGADLTYTDSTPQDEVRAIAAPVVAAELRRLADESEARGNLGDTLRSAMRARADQLDADR